MRYKNDKKISNLSLPDSFFQAQNAPKSVFGRGSAPDPPLGELTTLPRPPSRLGREILPPHSPPCSTPSKSAPRPPSTQNHGYDSAVHIITFSDILQTDRQTCRPLNENSLTGGGHKQDNNIWPGESYPYLSTTSTQTFQARKPGGQSLCASRLLTYLDL